jgi:hypothetical protein
MGGAFSQDAERQNMPSCLEAEIMRSRIRVCARERARLLEEYKTMPDWTSNDATDRRSSMSSILHTEQAYTKKISNAGPDRTSIHLKSTIATGEEDTKQLELCLLHKEQHINLLIEIAEADFDKMLAKLASLLPRAKTTKKHAGMLTPTIKAIETQGHMILMLQEAASKILELKLNISSLRSSCNLMETLDHLIKDLGTSAKDRVLEAHSKQVSERVNEIFATAEEVSGAMTALHSPPNEARQLSKQFRYADSSFAQSAAEVFKEAKVDPNQFKTESSVNITILPAVPSGNGLSPPPPQPPPLLPPPPPPQQQQEQETVALFS